MRALFIPVVVGALSGLLTVLIMQIAGVEASPFLYGGTAGLVAGVLSALALRKR